MEGNESKAYDNSLNDFLRQLLFNIEPDTNKERKEEFKQMSWDRLENLITKSSDKILHTILNKESGFNRLLDQEITRDSMTYILLALGKAADCDMHNSISEMIVSITSNSTFFLVKLPTYLVSLQVQNLGYCHLSSLFRRLLQFLQKFQIVLPSNAADVLHILLPLLKQTCKKLLLEYGGLHGFLSLKIAEIEKNNNLFLKKYNANQIKQSSGKEKNPEVSKKIAENKGQKNLILKKHNANEIKQASAEEKLHYMKPPEDFRLIPILPTADDILQACTFLRPNVVKGNYQDAEHYLDVQFRLLREDYIFPLREGIAEYLKLKKQGKSVKRCTNVQVYPEVHIVKEDFVDTGLVHMAHFKDERFSKVKWDSSKRFLTGSLLCFSANDFKTILFASVAKRETKKLIEGKLFVRFEEQTDKVLNFTPSKNFVVIETSAYFEAYRHNLSALKSLNEANLPMNQYIIYTQKNIKKPLYVSESTTYDMRPLLLPLNCRNVEDEINNLPRHISEKAQSVNILNENCWPSADDLKLDKSQYTAIKAAITKEFVLIQGPPGTGKTFVGLKIAQILLHNVKKWCPDPIQLPILVICQTNHALDQFLEGLLRLTKNVVRVGGGSKNENVSKYQLNNVKKRKKKLSCYIISQKLNRLKCLKTKIANIQISIAKCYKSVLGGNILFNYMLSGHFSSLKSSSLFLNDGKYILHDWLEVRIRDGTSSTDCLKVQNKNCRSLSEVIPRHQSQMEKDILLENNEYSDVEDDIDFIESQRIINPDEFEGVSYDLPLYQEEIEPDPYLQNKPWKIQDGKKEFKEYAESQLQNDLVMSEIEAKAVQNIWSLNIEDRWRLYKFWLKCYKEDKENEKYKLQETFYSEFQTLCQLRTEEDIQICQKADVVGMTTTGASKYRQIVQQLNPKIVIVEEAAEILESHIVTSLAPGTQHVILIGDHQQLRPNPTVHLLAVKYNLNVSLFERMIENGINCHQLSIQHRMRPEIASLISPHIYKNLKNHNSVAKFENIKGVLNNVFFVTHTYSELQHSHSKSKINRHEAKFILKLCKYFINQGYSSSQITVLTTYSGQLFEMKCLNTLGILRAVKFAVVDDYQGEENDIILISFVRSNEGGVIGFLKIANRVCVALSRAKKGLFCIGNFKLLAEKSELWRNIVEQLEKDNAIGPSLQLACQNHPEVRNVVASESDFDSVPEGGCDRKCEFRLPCGHVCPLMCHPYDKEHKKIKCQGPCIKLCVEGHLCPRKCTQECGPCKVTVTKTIETCGHTINIECHKKNEISRCIKLCDKYLECGHMCTNLCGEHCALYCFQKVNVNSKLCGHKVSVECFDYENKEKLAKICREPCRKELYCGHMCQGTCSRCYQGRIHTACTQPCKRILICGHECKSICSKSCPPCKRPCENRCVHRKCPNMCGELCLKCTEPCNWSCAHKKCKRACGEQCDRTACNEPCLKLLRCKHQCIGFCGEPCPILCRICDKEKLEEVAFGSADKIESKFIKLEDCNHIFELKSITQWMNHDIREVQEIQMKTCQKCKVVIRRNLRFSCIVKSCHEDIANVKRIVYGAAMQSELHQEELLQRLEENYKTLNLLMCTSLIDALASRKKRSVQELTAAENLVTILLSLQTVSRSCFDRIDKLQSRLFSFQLAKGEMPSNTDNESLLTKLETFVTNTIEWLTIFIHKVFFTASDQQLQELAWEVHRLKLIDYTLTFIESKFYTISSLILHSLLESIMSDAPFREAEAMKFYSDFRIYVNLNGGAPNEVTELKEQLIIKAMSFSKSQWYKFPNGYIYCITDCIGVI